MDKIIKWATGIMVIAIAAHFAVLNYVEPELENIASSQELNAAVESAAARPVAVTQIEEKPEEIEDPIPGRAVRLEAGPNGHFYLDAKVNGTQTSFLVDTGASLIALSYESAQNAGIRLRKSDFTHSASTANGRVPMAVVMLDSIRYKNILVHNVRAGVLPKGALGGANLLGNSFLNRLQEYKVSNGTLIMRP